MCLHLTFFSHNFFKCHQQYFQLITLEDWLNGLFLTKESESVNQQFHKADRRLIWKRQSPLPPTSYGIKLLCLGLSDRWCQGKLLLTFSVGKTPPFKEDKIVELTGSCDVNAGSETHFPLCLSKLYEAIRTWHTFIFFMKKNNTFTETFFAFMPDEQVIVIATQKSNRWIVWNIIFQNNLIFLSDQFFSFSQFSLRILWTGVQEGSLSLFLLWFSLVTERILLKSLAIIDKQLLLCNIPISMRGVVPVPNLKCFSNFCWPNVLKHERDIKLYDWGPI